MSNVATPKVYESGFKYIAGMALDASTWSKNYFDMLEHMNPEAEVGVLDRAGQSRDQGRA